jgi:maltose O-acetyltransferase
MSVASPNAPVAPDLPPAAIEAIGLRARLLARVRGELTLRRMRKLGLRAQPPIRLAARSVIDPDFAWAVEIGAYTIIANDVRIVAHDAALKRLTGYTEVRPVSIGRHCYIGAGTIVLPGAVIGDEAIIGAGSLVRGEIPAGSVAVGCPARVIGGVRELRERHLTELESHPRFERRPDDLSAAEIEELRAALAAHGRIYVL